MQFDFKKFKLDFIAMAIFAVLSLGFCLPQLNGKKLVQSDNISWQAMAHEAKTFHETTGKDALWTNNMFGGMPSYTIYVGTTNYNAVVYVQDILQAIGKPAYFFFIAMFCFYIMMRVFKVNHWLAVIGGMAYAFSTYNPIIIQVGHETKMLTMGYLPAAIAGLYLLYQNQWFKGAAVWGIAVALMITNNHFQVIYYSLFVFVAFGITMLVDAIKKGTIKNFAIATVLAIVIGLVGVGTGTSSILTTNEYAKETMRGGGSELSIHEKKKSGGLDKDYAFRWSNGIGETFCLMIPYLYGGASGESADKAPKTSELIGGQSDRLPLYWGPQPGVSGPVFFGAVICFLFILGMIVVKSAHKWWILGASLFCIMLSWGSNFAGINYMLFDTLPMLNKFRTPSMSLVIPELLFPMMALWAVHEVIERKKEKEYLLKSLKIAAGISAGLCLLICGMSVMGFFDFKGAGDANYQPELVKALMEDRASLATKSSFQSAFMILIVAGLIWAYLNDKLKQNMLTIGLGLVVALELLPVASNYLNESHYKDASEYEAEFEPTQADKAILQDKDPYYRVLDLSRDTYNDAVQAYFHKCIGGYSPAKMEIYQDLIERHMSQGFNGQVLNMLNTKYIIVGGRGREGQQAPAQVMPNPSACGNAWFVDELKWTSTADEEIDAMNAPKLGDTTIVPNAFDPKKTAIMRDKFKGDIGNYTFGKDSAANIKLKQYGLDELTYTSQNSKDGLAVFSDIYYKNGWKAYIDGKETPIVKANYVLRAIKVPAGQHTILFQFKPESFYTGQKVVLACSVLLLLVAAGAVVPMKKKTA